MSDDLIAFLRARLDEDERTARSAIPGRWIKHDIVTGVHVDDAAPGSLYGTAVADCRRLGRVPSEAKQGTARHIARHDPPRVLAEVEAKRRLVALHASRFDGNSKVCDTYSCCPESMSEGAHACTPCEHLRLLALPYADHPDYRGEWRP